MVNNYIISNSITVQWPDTTGTYIMSVYGLQDLVVKGILLIMKW